MTPQELLRIINRGNTLDDGDLAKARQLADEFPYFSIPQIVAAKAAARTENENAPFYISQAAIRVPNRSRLKKLIYEEWTFIPVPTFTPERIPSDEPLPTPMEQTEVPEDLVADPSTLKEESIEPTQPDESPSAGPVANRMDILKQLEENLSKLQKNGLENPSEPKSSQPANQTQSTDELIESIKKREKKEISNDKGREQIEIISQFANKSIRLSPLDNPMEPPVDVEDLSVKSTQINDSMISEGFAKILVKQKKLQEAIEIYGKLQLKYPDKKAYFADCIKKLEKK
ncbi:hypothetical protein ADIS_3694 [Lunatimonas lonarensis]|uniref:Tetratricopeptide repeat protein n=1 Tax=Lunatimonas lonarensis TaxID=1232681 RepID=R7ZP20_9BACT|nr:hypothetical protein [Lunatimonas lonarensis]EON75803.1 hypothetical protein ADIS_3694 [Lunatimonas lonarensis]